MPPSQKDTFEERRRGLRYAEILRMAASAAPSPELKRDVERLAGSIERRYGFNTSEKKEVVLSMVLDGARTINDLMVETGFPQQVLSETIKALETEGSIRIDRVSIHGTGRPSMMIIPIEIKLPRS